MFCLHITISVKSLKPCRILTSVYLWTKSHFVYCCLTVLVLSDMVIEKLIELFPVSLKQVKDIICRIETCIYSYCSRV